MNMNDETREEVGPNAMGNVLSSASAAVAATAVPLQKPPPPPLPHPFGNQPPAPPLLTALALWLDWWHLSRCSNKKRKKKIRRKNEKNKNRHRSCRRCFCCYNIRSYILLCRYLFFVFCIFVLRFSFLPWRFFNFF